MQIMPRIKQEKLLRDYVLQFVIKGPTKQGWIAHYLKCPVCGYYVYKGPGYDKCPCGNISIDSDMLRVSVRNTPEAEVEQYNEVKRK
jgi:hypothetical protein